jgi:hypothetical protein
MKPRAFIFLHFTDRPAVETDAVGTSNPVYRLNKAIGSFGFQTLPQMIFSFDPNYPIPLQNLYSLDIFGRLP